MLIKDLYVCIFEIYVCIFVQYLDDVILLLFELITYLAKFKVKNNITISLSFEIIVIFNFIQLVVSLFRKIMNK